MVTFGPHGKKHESWWGATVPPTGPVGTSATWVGWNFGINQDGRLAGFRRYMDAGEDGGCIAVLVSNSTFTLLAANTYAGNGVGFSAAGWRNMWLRPWVRLSQSGDYSLGIYVPTGHIYRQNNAWSGGFVTHNNIDLVHGFQSSSLSWATGTTPTYNANANGIDILFQAD